MYINMLMTIAVAFVGSVIMLKLKVPVGALVGSLAAVGIFSILTSRAYLPAEVKVATQIVSGLFVGSRIHRKDVIRLAKTVLPAIITVAIILLLSAVLGLGVFNLTDFSLSTSLFMCAPGGLVDMGLIALEFPYTDTAGVVVVQLVRMVYVLCFFPFLLKLILKHFTLKNPYYLDTQNNDSGKIEMTVREKITKITLTIIVSTAFGLFGKWLDIPAGTLMFAMIGSALLNIFFEKAYMPYRVKQIAQGCAGTLVGVTVTADAITQLPKLLVPVLMVMVFFTILTLLLSFILYKFAKMDFATAFCSCMPGSAADVALLSEEVGACSPSVSVIQIFRLVCVIIFYPNIITLLETVF